MNLAKRYGTSLPELATAIAGFAKLKAAVLWKYHWRKHF